MNNPSRLSNLFRRAFARTNTQTIVQRVSILRELVPGSRAVSEICCGDCSPAIGGEPYQYEPREKCGVQSLPLFGSVAGGEAVLKAIGFIKQALA
jgi:hypothetical protein